jgi:hypothetical protein
MCSASAGNRLRQSGQRYVAGFVLAAGRTAYQRAAAKSSISDDVYRTATPYSHDARVPAVALSAEVGVTYRLSCKGAPEPAPFRLEWI